MEATRRPLRIEAAPLYERAWKLVKQRAGLPAPAKFAWLYLATREVDRAGIVSVTARDLGDDQGTSDRSGRRALETLAVERLIEIVEREGRGSGVWRLRLLDPEHQVSLADCDPQLELWGTEPTKSDDPAEANTGGPRLAHLPLRTQSATAEADDAALALAAQLCGGRSQPPQPPPINGGCGGGSAGGWRQPPLPNKEQDRSLSRNKTTLEIPEDLGLTNGVVIVGCCKTETAEPPSSRAGRAEAGPVPAIDHPRGSAAAPQAVGGLSRRDVQAALAAETARDLAAQGAFERRQVNRPWYAAQLKRICPELTGAGLERVLDWFVRGELAVEDLASLESSLRPYRAGRKHFLAGAGGYAFTAFRLNRDKRAARVPKTT